MGAQHPPRAFLTRMSLLKPYGPIPQEQNGGRGGETRTHDLRFWRPLLYQLSYTPTIPVVLSASALVLRYQSLAGFARNRTRRCRRVRIFCYSKISATTPAPTVRPPSRMAKRSFSSIAIGTISSTDISTLSPGITISVPSGSVTTPVTSVVRK